MTRNRRKRKITISISRENYDKMVKLGITNFSSFIDNILTDYLDFLEERLRELREDEERELRKMLANPYLAIFNLLDLD